MSEWDLMKIARKLVKLLARGLTAGVGDPKPGRMCVEAAVCYAMGLPHSDNPPCVSRVVRDAKIELNDMAWSSREARAEGLREVAIAQLGSNDISDVEFRREYVKAVRRRFKDTIAKESKWEREAFRENLQRGMASYALWCLIGEVEMSRAKKRSKGDEVDQMLTLGAQCMLDALRACKSPGVAVLDQLKAEGVVPPSQFDEKVA